MKSNEYKLGRKKNRHQKEDEVLLNNVEVIAKGKLDAESIDCISEALVQKMHEMGVPSKEVTKTRLCVEDVMRVWAEQLGENTACSLVDEKHFMRSYLAICVDGKSIDPTQHEDSLFLSVSSNPNMVNALGLSAEYRYTGGVNKLMIHTSVKKPNAMQQVLGALVIALILATIMRTFIPATAVTISDVLLKPLLDTLMRIIKLISVPLVFLSIVCGINGMEDFAAFGKMGKRLIKRIIGMSLFFSSLACFIISFIYPMSQGKSVSSGNSVQAIINLVLDIVPPDLVTPIQTGNALQVIFVAILLGIGMLFISEDKNISITLLNQLNSVVQLLMRGISKILPALIFLCVMNIIINSNVREIAGIIIPLSTIIVISISVVIVYGLYASFVSKMPYFTLLKNQLPTYLMALSTASSAAVFNTNIECCCDKLHVNKNIAKFAIPFGQVLFMPGAALEFVAVTMFAANKYGIDIAPSMMLSLIFMAAIMAIASPPIPGGGISCITIIFTQLGLPVEAIPLVTTILLFTDYFSTACNIACLQQELLIEASTVSTIPLKRRNAYETKFHN